MRRCGSGICRFRSRLPFQAHADEIWHVVDGARHARLRLGFVLFLFLTSVAAIIKCIKSLCALWLKRIGFCGGGVVWLKVENKRSSIGQKFVVRCNSVIAGSSVIEERLTRGVAAARKTAEVLASTLNVTATVYGADADGEFVYGVHQVAAGAENADSPLIKRLFAESAAASLLFKDQLLADIPLETIKGFASLCSALGYIVAQHKQIKRADTPQISYSTLFRIFCGEGEPTTLSLAADDATVALLTRKLADLPNWMWLSELAGVGDADRGVIVQARRPNKVMLNIDGELLVIRPRTVFRCTIPESGAQFMLVVQKDYRPGTEAKDGVGLISRGR